MEKAMLDKLHDKYGEDFEIIPHGNLALRGKETNYLAWPVGEPERAFLVIGWREDGAYLSKDSYYGVIVHEEYVAMMEGIVRGVFPESKIRYGLGPNNPFFDEFTKSVGLEEALLFDRRPRIRCDIIIMVRDDGIDTYAERYGILLESVEKMVGTHLGALTVYYVSDEYYEKNGNEQVGYMPSGAYMGYSCGASINTADLANRRDEFVVIWKHEFVRPE
jgi:hypothetical protein